MKDITNEIELSFALNDAKVKFEKLMKQLKSARKRTYKYSEYRELWQSVQRRMEFDLGQSEEAHDQFVHFWKWTENCEKRYGISCSKQR